jgi:hypothetical protein
VNQLFAYGVTLDSLVIAFVQFVLVLIELQEMLIQELNCCVARLLQSCSNGPYQIYGYEPLTLLLHLK